MSIAIPVTLQSLLQSSFSVIDQVMIGQLGSESIAGIGLGGKFASIYSVVLGAVAAAAGIMLAQYAGQNNQKELRKSFYVNLLLALVLALFFTAVCISFPEEIMQLYTKDRAASMLAADYLKLYGLSFVFMAVTSIAAVMLRCMDAAVLPLIAGILSVLLNTIMNYVLIFGRLGLPGLGVKGAALSSVLSQAAACVLTLILLNRERKKKKLSLSFDCRISRESRKLFAGILAPILICEFLWSLGENVYGAIYGNMGTDACAAMTMTGPIQALLIGALSGLAQAAGIMIGKSLGNEEYDRAYLDSKKLMLCGWIGSLILSGALIIFGKYYVQIYNVGGDIKEVSYGILLAFALISPVKVQNMILGGGIIRSGGKTKYVMWVDIIGTWIFGVPLGLLAAFVWKLPIVYVYLILSLEEVVRLLIAFVLFRTKRWMRSL